jgi:uncharacterized phiE125 gp8 family phage protein
MSLKLITAPAVEAITLDEVKTALSFDGTDSDAKITRLIPVARGLAESRTRRKLINQTWELRLDAFPAAEIEIAMQPVSSIVSVQYIDTAGVLQTLAPDQYTLDEESILSAWVLPAEGVTWPATRDVANAVRVRFVAGYGASSAAVPPEIRQWMCVAIESMSANTGTVAGGNITELPPDFTSYLLNDFIIWEIG